MENRTTWGTVAGLNLHTTTPVIKLKAIAAATTGIVRLHSERGGAIVDVSAGAVRGAAAIESKSARRSAAQCHRRLGFFCKHRRSKSRSLGFTSLGTTANSGSRARTEARMSEIVSP